MSAPRKPSAAEEITGIPDDGYVEPLNPEDLEREIQRTRNRISRGIRVCHERRVIQAEKTTAYKRAYAFAYVAADGPQTQKRYEADTDKDVMAAEDEKIVADTAYAYAKDVADSLRDDLTALQSIMKSVIAMYGATTGRGQS